MRLLLDTHAFIWFINDNDKLSNTAKDAISDPNNTRLLSVAAVWEMLIKYQLGKLEIADQPVDFLEEQIEINQTDILHIAMPHFKAFSELPLHHRDPFDRIMIGQAIAEDIKLISVDENFDAYGVQRLW